MTAGNRRAPATRRILGLTAALLLATSGHAAGSLPCPDRGRTVVMDGALPAAAARLAAGGPLTIVTIGSSSTAGAGASSPDRSYPSRLAVALRSRYPGRSIEVVNAGVNGQEVPEMLARLDRDVVTRRPDLVIWQFGSNSLLRRRPLADLEQGAREGIGRLQAAGIEVVMMDLQHAPRIDRIPARDDVLAMMERLHRSTGAALFRRYRLMRAWEAAMGPDYGVMVAADELHMTDASYACLASVLADDLVAAMVPGNRRAGRDEPPDGQVHLARAAQPGVSTRSTSSATMSASVPLSQPR
jgi:acyl-CoA thioesterase-1